MLKISQYFAILLIFCWVKTDMLIETEMCTDQQIFTNLIQAIPSYLSWKQVGLDESVKPKFTSSRKG